MARAYRLRTVPSWDQGATPVAFFATAVALGALAVAAGLALRGAASTDPARGPIPLLATGLVVLAFAAELAGRVLFYEARIRSGL